MRAVAETRRGRDRGDRLVRAAQQQGRLLQAQARARQSEIGADDLERQVRLEVVRVLGSLLDAVDALAQAEAAGQSFERTVNAEIQKLRLGEATQLDAVLTAMGKEPWEVTRMGEAAADELGLKTAPKDRATWIAAMVANPILIERPILVTDDGRAAVGRPTEAIAELL